MKVSTSTNDKTSNENEKMNSKDPLGLGLNMMIYAVIGGGVLVLLIVIVFVCCKMKSSRQKRLVSSIKEMHVSDATIEPNTPATHPERLEYVDKKLIS